MRTIAVGLVVLLAVAGCSSDSKSTASGSSASTNTASTSSAASTSGPTTTFKSAFVGTGDVFFLSPSKNIGCALSDTAVRCDIRDRSWQPPPKPASCDVDFGQGITIVGTSPASFTCAGDTVLVGDAVLEYGSFVRRGDFECRSETAAMSCRNVKSGHAFSLAKEKFTLD